MIGNLGYNDEDLHLNTAITKTDCIVIIIDKNIINILNKHKEKIKRDALSSFFTEHIPFFGKLYT